MKHLIHTASRYPWFFIAGLALITALAASQLHKLHINISAESMLEKDTPAWHYLQRSNETFGSDSITVIYVEDEALFSPPKLAALKTAIDALEQLPFVQRTSSLFSSRNVKNVDDEISTRYYLEELPSTPEEVVQVRADALANPLLKRNLISADGRALAINLITEKQPHDPAFDQRAAAAIDEILQPLRAELDNVFQIGNASVRNALTGRILQDQRTLMPLSLLVLLFILVVSLRRLSGAIIPLITAGLSVVWTLGFMAWLDIPVNIMTSIVPALIIVIGSTEDIHLLSEYLAGVRKGLDRHGAIQYMTDNMGLTVFLTFITTYLGFLSITLNDIELLYQFGLITSSGLLFNYLITVSLVPILLRVMGEKTPGPARSVQRNTGIYQRFALFVLRIVRQHKLGSLVIIVSVAALGLFGTTQLRVNNNPLDFLEKSSPIHAQKDRVHREMSGIHTFSIVVESGIDDTFLQVKYLEELQMIQQQLDDMGVFDRSLSFADFIAYLNQVMEEASEPYLPDTSDIVREYMLFIRHQTVKSYVTESFDKARILVRHNIGSSEQLNAAIAELEAFVDREIDPALRVTVTGEEILSNQAVDAMANGQLQSLILVGIAVVIVVGLLFVNPRAGLVALLPNLFPVIVLFGVMGFLGISLNAGTSMVAAIALGMCVDDTMHAMSRYHQQLRIDKDSDLALTAMVRAEALPIFTTSVALAMGFGILAFSSFIPVAHFGMLSAMVILLALLATFFITPLLLGSAELLTVWDLISLKVRNEYLKQSPLFQGLNLWQIKKVLLASEIRNFNTGEQILTEGEEGTEMFVVLDGQVDACKTDEAGSVQCLRKIGAGEIFGEVAAFAGGKRTADVIARRDTELLVLSWDSIDKLSRLFPFITFRLFRNLSSILGSKLAETKDFAINAKQPTLAAREGVGR